MNLTNRAEKAEEPNYLEDDPTTSHSEQWEAIQVVFNIAAEADTPTEVCTRLLFS